MKRRIAAFLFLLTLQPFLPALAGDLAPTYEHAVDGKLMMGEKEWVKIDDTGDVLKARVDTGATTSSISAVDIDAFRVDGKRWVRFRLAHDGVKSEIIERPVKRVVRIMQSSAEGYDRRYVVELPITIGDVTEETEFTLRDRQHLIYPVLLGRSYLRDTALVDVSRRYVQPKP